MKDGEREGGAEQRTNRQILQCCVGMDFYRYYNNLYYANRYQPAHIFSIHSLHDVIGDSRRIMK